MLTPIVFKSEGFPLRDVSGDINDTRTVISSFVYKAYDRGFRV
jgi:hypothetical protein